MLSKVPIFRSFKETVSNCFIHYRIGDRIHTASKSGDFEEQV